MSTSNDQAADTGDEHPDMLAGPLVPDSEEVVPDLTEEDDDLGEGDEGEQIPDPQQDEEE